MNNLNDLLIVYLPAIAFLATFIITSKLSNNPKTLWSIVIGLTLFLFMTGYVTADNWTEITPIGNALIFTSSLWLIGPTLTILELKRTIKSHRTLVIAGLTLILPPTGTMLCFGILLFTNQITGV